MARRQARRARSDRRTPESLPTASWWEQRPAAVQHGICIGALLLVVVVFFAPYFLDGKTFLGHDVVQWRAGAQSLVEAHERYGESPLWATHMFSGMPAAVISHARQIPNVDTVIRRVLGGIYPITEYGILLVGAYVLFILLGFRPLTAVIGALIVGFTTYIPIIIGAGHQTKFWAYTYVPWFMVGYVLVTRRPPWRLVGVVLFVFALSLHLRQSHPQVTYYFLYVMIAWWIFDLVRAWRSRALGAHAVATGWLAVAGVIAALTVIQPYWAMLEYSPYSTRGGSEIEATGGLGIDYAYIWSQGWGELLTLVVPDLYGGAEVYWGDKPGTGGPHYFGAIAFLLLVIGLIRGSHELKWLFFGIGILTMFFSLGRHFPALNETMFHLAPGFDKFRTPEMWLMATVFCFTVVALTGLDWIIDRAQRGAVALKEVYVPFGLVIGFALILAFGGSALFSFERPNEREMIAQQIARQANVSPEDPRVSQAADQYVRKELRPERMDRATSDAMRLLIFVGLGAGALLLGMLGKVPMVLSVAIVAALTAVDMLTVGGRYIDSGLVDRGTDPVEVLERSRRPVDAFLEENVQTDEGWSYRVLPLADNPFNNAIPAYFYPSVGGYSGAKMGIYQDVIDRALFTGERGLNVSLLDMLNVRYVTHTAELPFPEYRVAFRGDQLVVNESQTVLPKAFFVDSLVVGASPEEALAFISRPFDASSVAILEDDDVARPSPDPAANVRVTEYRPRVIEVEARRSTDGFLVLSEIYYPPGWRASIDGRQVPIRKTNYILRGVSVPAGEHVIRFEFNPPSYRIGMPIATAANILMWLGLVLVVGLVVVRRRRGFGRSEPEDGASPRAS